MGMFSTDRDIGEPYENLALAIIEIAIRDYERALVKKHKLLKLKKSPKQQASIYIQNKTIRECEEFFLGDYIKNLTNIDGAYIKNKTYQMAMDKLKKLDSK